MVKAFNLNRYFKTEISLINHNLNNNNKIMKKNKIVAIKMIKKIVK